MRNRILFLVQLPPPVHGVSITNQKILESESLLNSGIDISVIPLRFSNTIDEIDSLSLSKVYKTISVGLKLFKNCLFNRPDLVYFTLSVIGKTFYRDVFFVAILKILKCKIVYHLHRVGVYDAGLNNKIRHYLYKWVFSEVYLIHLTPRLYDDVSVYVDRSRCYFISNGIDDPLPGPTIIPVESVDSPIRLLFLSHMVQDKGVIVFLHALKMLKERGISYKAVFAGGRLAPECQVELKIAQSACNDYCSIEYVGPVYGNDKWSLFSNTDVFVFPTLYDAFGIVLLEAMAYSLPVVATMQGGIPDIVDDGTTGFLIDKNSPEQLANKIELLSKSIELRKSMGRRGRKKFESMYTNDIFEKNIVNTLELLLAR